MAVQTTGATAGGSFINWRVRARLIAGLVAISAILKERAGLRQDSQKGGNMHNTNTTNSYAAVAATAEKPPRASQADLNGVPVHTDGCTVIALPPNRDKLAADLRSINRQCFLMSCELHRGLLVNLLDVPNKTLVAAQKLIRPKEAADWSRLWCKTLILCVQALTDGREQILAATRLHGLKEHGQNAADAINSIETALPSFLRAVAQTPEDRGELPIAAKQMATAARMLDEILAGLLETVELSIERAKACGISNQSGSQPRNPQHEAPEGTAAFFHLTRQENIGENK